MKDVIINQHQGLGDVLFCIPIAKHYHDKGHKIIWYINEPFLEIQRHFDFIEFRDKDKSDVSMNIKKSFETDDYIYLSIRYGKTNNFMREKYDFLNLPLDMWRTLTWKRFTEKEDELYYDVLGLKDDEEYNFITDTFSSRYKIPVDTKNNYKNVVMNKTEGFTMLDWAKVIINAKTIHIVGTSVIIIIDVLDTKADEYHLYARRPFEQHCNYYNYLLTKPYIEH